MCEAKAFLFRGPKSVVDNKASPTPKKCKNKWAATIFNELQTARKVQCRCIRFWSMFKDYDLYKVGVLSTRMEDMNFILAEEICHGSSGKEWRKVSSKESDATLKRRTELRILSAR